MRLISLACSNTEILAALGCQSLLVGVDDHSDHPPEALEKLPRVGPDLDIDMDRVEALAPDLVLASLTVPGHETVVEGLEVRGIPHLALEPTSIEDVYANITLVAEHLEAGGVMGVRDRALRLVEAMRSELDPDPADPAHETAESNGPRPSILIQWWPKPVISPGRRSWVDPLIRRAGGRNPLGHEDRPSRPLEDGEVAELAPDAIVVAWCGVHPSKYRPEVVYRNEAFRNVPAVRNGRVICIPEAYLGRPGPRLVEGLKALREVVATVRSD
ncbi:MAG: cobalamin-binding protein [Gemmatimonadales bacterium]|nr:MAG: cobalamin-binding protein [Gemmatimonadales bacterium]